ncbi:DUF1289 domain-containing protein [Nitratireductor sp. CH_MIT9313-5]|uniref:DUF1289 domain-containing protein n=1 Tax=Nitratireductor sp. CH_MIT9313-5 TaxID=3107764 RepID=UPI00300982E3
MPTIQSPCISVCNIDRESDLCRGCGRTLEEIASWMRFSPEQRKAVMADLPARLEKLNTRNSHPADKEEQA